MEVIPEIAGVLVGDCVATMAGMGEGCVDAIVTDPPYGLEFMGKDWDRLVAAPRGRTAGSEHEPTLEARDDSPQHRAGVRQPSMLMRCETCGGSSSGEWNRCRCARPEFRRNLGPTRAMQAWHEAWARKALQVLKPGGYLLAFGGTRTYHRLACALEDAGFELRDEIMWLYGSGFPKSLTVGKAIEVEALALRRAWLDGPYGSPSADALADARLGSLVERAQAQARYEGAGTALKPAHEPIVVARKRLSGTVAGNVLAHGTGALNIDACRIGFASSTDEAESNRHADFGSGPRENAVYGEDLRARGADGNYDASGRWPANVVLSHSEDCVMVGQRQARANGHFPAARGPSGYGAADGSNAGGLHGQDDLTERRFDGETVEVWACVPGCPVRTLDEQTRELVSGRLEPHHARHSPRMGHGGTYGDDAGQRASAGGSFGGDRGGASRFFYVAKASRAERNAGLDGVDKKPILWSSGEENPGSFQVEGTERSARNPHPTVKPIDLMRWLIRLVTPPGGRVLDPFAGSGSTGCAAALEGFEFVGIEQNAEYVAIADARIRFWREHPTGLPVELALRAEDRRRKTRDAGQLGLGF